MVLNLTMCSGPGFDSSPLVPGVCSSAMAVTVKECLELQLLEVEMLLSMFPRRGEFNLDADAVPSIQRYLRNAEAALPPQLEYRIALDVGETKVRAFMGGVGFTPSAHPLKLCPEKNGEKKPLHFCLLFEMSRVNRKSWLLLTFLDPCLKQ